MGRLTYAAISSALLYNKFIVLSISEVESIGDIVNLLIHLGQYVVYRYPIKLRDENVYCTGKDCAFMQTQSGIIQCLANVRNKLCHCKNITETISSVHELEYYIEIESSEWDDVVKHGLELLAVENLERLVDALECIADGAEYKAVLALEA